MFVRAETPKLRSEVRHDYLFAFIAVWKALANGTAWAGLGLIRDHQPQGNDAALPPLPGTGQKRKSSANSSARAPRRRVVREKMAEIFGWL